MNKYHYMKEYLYKWASYDMPEHDPYSTSSAQNVAMQESKKKLQAAGGSKGLAAGAGAGLLAGGLTAKISRPFADAGSKFTVNPMKFKMNARNASILGAGLYAGYKVNKRIRDKQRGVHG